MGIIRPGQGPVSWRPGRDLNPGRAGDSAPVALGFGAAGLVRFNRTY